uniref:AlNc14C1G10 protein n=1 Tax=Albugo laibachii Nc14 TaxID=890382 RepID=F0VYK3_9STRA|nr:AlNc14C1G10 [Albugo laibachii Nc14]|eukprot:CCA13867.1 AlNc14C1G10 [Albugo laibachii Nc14]
MPRLNERKTAMSSGWTRCVALGGRRKANQQNLAPLDGVEADVRRTPVTNAKYGAGDRGRNAGGKVIDPLEENVAVDEALFCGQNDEKGWNREAACCHGGNEREMKAGLGSARGNGQRAAICDDLILLRSQALRACNTATADHRCRQSPDLLAPTRAPLRCILPIDETSSLSIEGGSVGFALVFLKAIPVILGGALCTSST